MAEGNAAGHTSSTRDGSQADDSEAPNDCTACGDSGGWGAIDPAVAGAVLNAIQGEYDHEVDRFRQVEQKCGILVTFSSATLALIVAKAIDLSPVSLTLPQLPLGLAIVCLVVAVVLAFHSLWFRTVKRLGFQQILTLKEMQNPAPWIQARLAETYVRSMDTLAKAIDSKIASFCLAAYFTFAALLLVALQSIIPTGEEPESHPIERPAATRQTQPAEGDREDHTGGPGADEGPQWEDDTMDDSARSEERGQAEGDPGQRPEAAGDSRKPDPAKKRSRGEPGAAPYDMRRVDMTETTAPDRNEGAEGGGDASERGPDDRGE